MGNRREFLSIVLVGAASAAAMSAGAQTKAAPQLEESDPVGMALGYKKDATKVDKAKFPKYAAGQTCVSCQLYQGKPTDAMAPCPTFANKLVEGKGWCNAWVKRA